MKLNIRLPGILLPSAVGTILDSKWSNRFGRYRVRKVGDRQFVATRRNVGYTGKALRDIRKFHR